MILLEADKRLLTLQLSEGGAVHTRALLGPLGKYIIWKLNDLAQLRVLSICSTLCERIDVARVFVDCKA